MTRPSVNWQRSWGRVETLALEAGIPDELIGNMLVRVETILDCERGTAGVRLRCMPIDELRTILERVANDQKKDSQT